jgi:aryl sulfotransferase
MDFEEIYDVVPWDIMALDCGTDLDDEQVGNPRIFKSHEGAADIAKGGRYIHVCRNPEDAFMSFYRFLPEWAGIPAGAISIEEFAEAIFGGVSHSGGIWDFYVDWWKRRDDPSVLWVCYEDLKDDLRGQIQRIAKFMGVECDDKLLSIVEEKSSFAYMEAHQRQFDEHVVFAKVRDQMGIPKDFVQGATKVRTGGGKTGEGKIIPHPVLEMLRQRWNGTVKAKIGLESYEDLRKAVAEL